MMNGTMTQTVVRATAPKQGETPKKLSFAQSISAGATAGVCELLCLYPLDVVKTRQQLVAGSGSGPVNPFSSLWSIFRSEGFLRLYRGMAAPFVQEPIKRAVKFSANAQYNNFFIGESEPTLVSKFLCGSLAGATEASFIAPFEVVKIRMQSKSRLGTYKNSLDCASKMLAAEGPFSFLQGIEAAMWRSGIWNGTYFAAIWTLKNRMPLDEDAGKILTMSRNFTAGFFAGIFATVLNNPFDVAVSRMRNVVPGEERVYRWAWSSLGRIASTEGFLALYKGFPAKAARLGPGGGIMIVAYDLAMNFFSSS